MKQLLSFPERISHFQKNYKGNHIPTLHFTENPPPYPIKNCIQRNHVSHTNLQSEESESTNGKDRPPINQIRRMY